MMLSHAICVLLAPAVTYGAAFSWALPEPTAFAPAVDTWSPAPTAAAQLPGFELFRRQAQEGNNTCAFVSGSMRMLPQPFVRSQYANIVPELSITCSNTNYACVTNTLNGVHGCCDPKSLHSCTIPTTCIASTAMSTLCTDAACSSNSGIVRCTEAAMSECYRLLIVYSTTTMTQHGCASQAFTSTAMRSPGHIVSSIPHILYRTATVTVLTTPSDTPTLTPISGPSKPNLGAIVGGTIGGCTMISILVLTIILIRRRRKATRNNNVQSSVTRYHDGNGNVTEYNPHGFTATTYPDDNKAWQDQNAGPVSRANDAMPQYPGMAARQYGIVEVDGLQRPVEAPAEDIYQSRAYTRT